MRSFVISTTTLASLAGTGLCWGSFGHEITATIAQIHLFPSTREKICRILPSTFKCHLAGVASWPDLIKEDYNRRQYNGLHFVNVNDDHPPQHCDFGSQGWIGKGNILTAIVDRTRQVQSGGKESDEALRFLVHFLGDIHQPFHLAGRFRGANDVNVLYNGQRVRLHGLWDDNLINDMILRLTNYTSPVPTTPGPLMTHSILERNRRIESALRGSIYDPYIRWILFEGIYQWWVKDLTNWTTCPQFEPSPAHGAQTVLGQPPFEDPVDLPACPYHWAAQTHTLLCGFIWPEDLTNTTLPRELNGTEYAGRVRDEKIIEKELALGGMRLAAVLNGVLGSEEDKVRYGAVPLLF